MCTARCTHTSTTSYANIVIINKRNGWKSTQDAVFWVLRCGLVNLYDLHAYMFLCFFCACCCPFCWREAGGRIIIIKMKKNKRRKLQYNIGFYITHRFLPIFSISLLFCYFVRCNAAASCRELESQQDCGIEWRTFHYIFSLQTHTAQRLFVPTDE